MSEENKFEFRAGDIVSFGGVEDIVEERLNQQYPIQAGGNIFTRDGRLYHYHTEPLLKLVKRPKRKMSRKIWCNVYEKFVTSWTDENGARQFIDGTRKVLAVAVPVTVEWEEE